MGIVLMRVLICGGRKFTDKAALFAGLDHVMRNMKSITLLIHGNAFGTDRLAGDWAKENNIPVMIFPAEWKRHGYAAGPIRNQQMLDEGKPDLVVAFPGGAGTKDMTDRATKNGIVVFWPLAVLGFSMGKFPPNVEEPSLPKDE